MTPTMMGMVPSTEGSPAKATKAIPQKHAPKLFFQVILGSVNLTTNPNHGNSAPYHFTPKRVTFKPRYCTLGPPILNNTPF